MAWTIHRFESEEPLLLQTRSVAAIGLTGIPWGGGCRSVLQRYSEHIVLIMLPMTRSLPELDIVHERGMHLIVTALPVLLPKHGLDGIEDASTMGEKKRRARRERTEPEELLMVSRLRFLHHRLPLLQIGRAHV